MLVVHALHSPARGVLLWAEDGERPARSGRRSLRTARPHPFAVPSDELSAVHPGKPASVTVLLPSYPSAPQDSPGLVRTTPRAPGRSAVTLAPWTVPALLVDPSELTDPCPEVRYGADVTHLAELVRFADELAARGRVLPVLTTESGRPAARWRPVVQGLDAVARTDLVRRVPAVARAEQRRPGDVAGQDPGELVDGALARFVDAAVRDRLGRAVDPPPAPSGVVGSLLHALTGPAPQLPVEGRELQVLREGLTVWEEIGREQPGAGTALFRLTEVSSMHDPADPGPDPLDQTGEGTRWELGFALQSTEDPSLQLPAADVWAGAADGLVDGAQDVLLAELGRAAQVLPDLVRALREARPTALALDVTGAHRFLTRDASALLAAGFGVALPRGWDGQRALGLKLSASAEAAPGVVTRGGLGRDELARFRWSLAVGDEELGEDEITALVAAKAPLVRLRGRWVAIDADALARGLDFLRRSRDRAPTVPDVLAAARGDVDAPLPVTDVSARGRLGALLAGTADRELQPLPAPPGFTATLRPYQERGVAWLAFLSSLGLGACLADDMGLGKTVQLLALEAHDRAGGGAGAEGTAPTLIVCPMSMVGTWAREAERFAPGLRVHAHHGAGRPRGGGLHRVLGGADLVVTTYATATRDAEDLRQWRFHRLVLDEAQMIKNSRSAAARSMRSLDAAHRIALTGTPMENRLAELWSVMDFLNPGVLGTAEVFRQRFAVPVERHRDAGAARTLRRITRPYLLRRLKTDPQVIDDLPEKIEMVADHRLTREQASLYRTVVDDMMEKIEGTDGIERRGNVLAAMSKLKQVCNHPAQLLHDGSPIHRAGGRHRSGKVARLEEILESVLAAGDRALLFTQYTEFAAMLRPHLSARFDTEVLYLHGGTPKKRRDEMVARFQGEGGPALFLLSLKAGGTGLTLTAANQVIHLDRWWNPAVEDQGTDRAFRIGQTRSVQVRRFVCPGTVEERIDELVASKRSLSDMVVTGGEDWLTSLSTTELREVFALGSDAVADDLGDSDE
ncbi:DEAD/DEAH box helicase [Pseudonocardia sp. HH130630-07]|uniref:DEAD/DEAH box helicase n=1 Tax=Pseudonocardia sp. HH130630-07 TaxID=1690815 RepID=UPI000814DE0B|nr:DEAD/DEAH box helicase [Pseudonocardia sp. HH130630-07]ANY09578.1 helicase HelZ [Pseudonocardia sp. HH130630-07]